MSNRNFQPLPRPNEGIWYITTDINHEQLRRPINHGDINNAFCHLEEDDVADVCDGDIQLLDKAVKRFKTTIWENQFET